MTKKFNNKKRNVGILYELLARKVSEGLVEDNQITTNKAIKIIQDSFTHDSVLLSEYRLFTALSKTYVESDQVISRLLTEAKSGAISFDFSQLEHEKSRLIKKINKTFNDEDFFNTKLPNYKQHATIQTLLSAWRSPDKYGLGKIAEYEQKVSGLLKERKETSKISSHKTDNIDSLTLKLMIEKFNKKFKDLSSSQKNVVNSVIKNKDEKIKAVLEFELERVKNAMSTLKRSEDSKWLHEKVKKVEDILSSIDVKDTSEPNLKRFMTLTHLSNVINDEEI
jgi:hypothetical protein